MERAAQTASTPLAALRLRDRVAVLSAIGAVTVLSWLYLADMARGMDGASMTMLGLALAGLGGYVRRRRNT